VVPLPILLSPQNDFDLDAYFWYSSASVLLDEEVPVNTLLSILVLAQAVQGSAPVGQPQAPGAPAVQAASVVEETATAAPATATAPMVPMAAQDQQGSMWTTLIFFGVMILVFWLLIIRPQQKQRKKQEQFLTSLKPGDKVVLASGFIGRIANMTGDVVTIELDKDVRVRVVKSQIASHFKEEGEAKA